MGDKEAISKEELLKIVDESLQNGEPRKALDALRNPNYAVSIETSTWDIVPNIVEKLGHSDNKISASAQEILSALVQVANPEEMLLELIVKAEETGSDKCFLALLLSMQLTLARMPEKRGQSLQWCLNTISQRLTSESSENESDESEEEPEECDKPSLRPLKLYRAALEFCKPFINEVSLTLPAQSYDKPVVAQRERQRRVLISFFIQAFSEAIANVDVHYDGETKTPYRLLAEDFVDAVCHLCSDVLYFLNFMEERSQVSMRSKTKDTPWEEINPFLFESVTPSTGLGALYYMILVEGVRIENAPSVYSPLFILQNILDIVVALITRSENAAMFKGLEIAVNALRRVGRPPLPCDILDCPVHSKFCKAVIGTVFRSVTERTARLAVSVFKTYLKSFGQKGQYQILKNLFETLDEPGPKGFLVTQLKDAIDRSLKEHRNEDDVSVFRGASLFRLIVSFCSLPDGSETDPAVHADHILSIVNLLWYLALRKDSKILGVTKHLEWFEDKVMEPLGEALDRCRKDYEQQKVQLSETSKEHAGEGAFSDVQDLDAVETTLNKLILMSKLLADADLAMNSWRDE